VIESPIRNALADSVRDVLEKMCFLDLSAPAAEQPTASRGVAAQLAFDGDPPGLFRLDLDENAARLAAAGFLGENPAHLAAEQMQEVVCELANMVCGSILSRIESSAVFRLAKPEPARDPLPCSSTADATILCDGPLRVEIRMERPVCPEIGGPAF